MNKGFMNYKLVQYNVMQLRPLKDPL